MIIRSSLPPSLPRLPRGLHFGLALGTRLPPKYPWCQRFLFSYLSKLISAAKSMSSKAVTASHQQKKKPLSTPHKFWTIIIISPNRLWSWFTYYVVFITLKADFNLTWPCDEYNGLSHFQIVREGF